MGHLYIKKIGSKCNLRQVILLPSPTYKIISDTITNAYDKYFPLIETRFRRDRHNVQPWMNDDLRVKIAVKDKIIISITSVAE